jgi:hypothetical protein
MKPWFDSSLQGMRYFVKGISRSVAPIVLKFQSMKTEKVIKKYQVSTDDYKSNHPNNSNFTISILSYRVDINTYIHRHNMIRHNCLAGTQCHMIRRARNVNTKTYHNDEHSPNCKRVASLDTFAIPQNKTEVGLIEQKSLGIISRKFAMVPPVTQEC